MEEPNYEEYSLEELVDVYEQIDRERYPERYNKIVTLINEKKGPDTNNPEAEEALRELYKESRTEKFNFFRIFRGAFILFVSIRLMEYFEWSNEQRLIGAVCIVVVYVTILIAVNESRFEKFKKDFEKKKD